MTEMHEQDINCRAYCKFNDHGACNHENPDAVMKKSKVSRGTYLLCKSFKFDKTATEK